MPTRKLNRSLNPIVLGPQALSHITGTLNEALPVLTGASYRILPNGGMELTDPEALEAVRDLRGAVEAALPPEALAHVGEKSGLGWNIFFGHVVAFWLPQRARVGFLRALRDRAALHGVELEMHWNAGRRVAPRLHPVGAWVLAVGTLVGMLAGGLVQRTWPYSPALPLLTAGAGLVGGRLYQRYASTRTCGDHLCQAPLSGSSQVCPGCGATVAHEAALAGETLH